MSSLSHAVPIPASQLSGVRDETAIRAWLVPLSWGNGERNLSHAAAAALNSSIIVGLCCQKPFSSLVVRSCACSVVAACRTAHSCCHCLHFLGVRKVQSCSCRLGGHLSPPLLPSCTLFSAAPEERFCLTAGHCGCVCWSKHPHLQVMAIAFVGHNSPVFTTMALLHLRRLVIPSHWLV